MRIKIRKLKDSEIDILINEVKKFPDITYINQRMWKKFGRVHIALINRRFAGVCASINLGNWTKIGPFIMLEKYQGKGYGNILLEKVVKDLNSRNLFVASSNQKVKHILNKLGFSNIENVFTLPKEILWYGTKYIIKSLSFTFLKEIVRKKIFYKRGKFTFFSLVP